MPLHSFTSALEKGARPYALQPRKPYKRAQGALQLIVGYENVAVTAAAAVLPNAADGRPAVTATVPAAAGGEGLPAVAAALEDDVFSAVWREGDDPESDDDAAAALGSAKKTALPEGWSQRQDRNGRVLYSNNVHRFVTAARPTMPAADVPLDEITRRRLISLCERQALEEAEQAGLDQGSLTGSPTEPEPEAVGVATVDSPASPASHPRASVTLEETGERPLPKGWVKHRTPGGKIYFIDHNTQTTTWTDPRTQHEDEEGEKSKKIHLKNENGRRGQRRTGPEGRE